MMKKLTLAFDSLNQLCDLLESIDCDKWEFFEQTIQQLINWKVNTLEHLLLELRSQLFSFSSDQLEAASGNPKKSGGMDYRFIGDRYCMRGEDAD